MVKYSFEDLIKFCKENKFELRENFYFTKNFIFQQNIK